MEVAVDFARAVGVRVVDDDDHRTGNKSVIKIGRKPIVDERLFFGTSDRWRNWVCNTRVSLGPVAFPESADLVEYVAGRWQFDSRNCKSLSGDASRHLGVWLVVHSGNDGRHDRDGKFDASKFSVIARKRKAPGPWFAVAAVWNRDLWDDRFCRIIAF